MNHANLTAHLYSDSQLPIACNVMQYSDLKQESAAKDYLTGQGIWETCKDYLWVDRKNRSHWLGFVLARPQEARYTSISKAAGPLPQGMLSLGGSFFSCGGRP